MTIERKLALILIPLQTYCVLALLSLWLCRAAFGHEAKPPLIMFLAWSSIVSSFLWLIAAAIQARFRITLRAGLNAVGAILSLFAAAYMMPYLAR